MIDYRALLEKYMQLVHYHEGITYVHRASDDAPIEAIFSAEEVAELQTIEEKIQAKIN